MVGNHKPKGKISCAALLLLVSVSHAQPVPAELYGHIDYFRVGSDEGTIGTAPAYGALLSFRFTKRLAFDLDAQTAEVTVPRPVQSFYRTRRTLLLPGLLYRWGSERNYLFAGGGLGFEHRQAHEREDNFAEWYVPGPPWQMIAPGIYEIKFSQWRNMIHVKTGAVVSPHCRFPLRFEFYIANWHMGLRLAFGYRFGCSSC